MPSILITGVSSGIGRATADEFARAGWQVIGTVRDVERAASIDWPGDVRVEALDLAEPGSATALAGRVVESYGCPHVLLNNAGILQWGPIEFVEQGELEHIFQVNVFGPLELTRAVVPHMRERGSGTVAFVTSIGGRMVFPYFAVYNSTKHALEGIAEGLWHELAPFGIRVKAIEPGNVGTPLYEKQMKRDGVEAPGPAPYARYMHTFGEYERGLRRTPPSETARDIYSALTDGSDRLRYPISAFAAPILFARRALGEQFMIRYFHRQFLGREVR